MLPRAMMEVMKTLRTPRYAAICRRQLQDLETARERRGSYVDMGMQLLVVAMILTTLVICWIEVAVEVDNDLVWLIGGYGVALSILLFVAMGMQEVAWQMYNSAEDVFRWIAPALADGERCIAYSYGALKRLHVTCWKKRPGTYAFFVFTTDRLLCVKFNSGVAGLEQIGKCAEKDKMWLAVSDIKAVDLWDPEAVDLGPIIPTTLLNLTLTRITIKPIGEVQEETWYLRVDWTRNGDSIKEILQRRKAYHCQ